MSFVWMRKRDKGQFDVVKQVTISEIDFDRIADILGIPKNERGTGTMYIATKKPPHPTEQTRSVKRTGQRRGTSTVASRQGTGTSTTTRRTRQRK